MCALAPCALAFRCLQGGEFREVWYPQRSRAALDAKWAESMWGEWPRSSVWIGHVRGSSSNATAGALSKEALLEALDTHEAITGVGSPDVAAAWRDICDNIFKVSAVPSSPEEASDAEKGAACNAHAVSSVLAAWDFDRAALERETTASILARLSAIELVSVSGVPLEPLDTLLGGIARSASGGVAGATAARHAYRTNREDRAIAWEWDGIISAVRERAYLSDLAQKDGDIAVTGDEEPSLTLDYAVLAYRTYQDEQGRGTERDGNIMTAAVVAMLIYVTVCFYRPERPRRCLLGAWVVIVVGLALGSAFGVAALWGLLFTELSLMAVFTILGVGVDDAFIIGDAFERARETSPTSAVALESALREVGPSVLLTSLTDFVAFVIGAAIDLPSISNFCLTAAMSVVAVVLLQMTAFGALLVLEAPDKSEKEAAALGAALEKNDSVDKAVVVIGGDRDRTESGLSPAKADSVGVVIDATTTGGFASSPSPTKMQGYMRVFAVRLLRPRTRCVVILCFAALSGFLAAIGPSNLKRGANWSAFLPRGSYALDFYDSQEAYFAELGALHLYVERHESDLADECAKMKTLSIIVSGLRPQVLTPLQPWWDAAEASIGEPCGGTSDSVKAWVESTESGQAFAGDIVFDDATGLIAASRARAFGRWQKEAADKVAFMHKARGAVDAVGLEGAKLFADHFLWLSRYDAIMSLTWQSIGGAIGATFLLAWLFLQPVEAVLTTLMVASVLISIVGCMEILAIPLNVASLVNLVLAIGFSVDYSAHIAEGFSNRRRKGDSAVDAAVSALSTLGASVAHGGASTMVAVLLLAFSDSLAYRTIFEMFFCMVVFGLLHGLVLLPCLLATLG